MTVELDLSIPYNQKLYPFGRAVGDLYIWNKGVPCPIKSLQSTFLSSTSEKGFDCDRPIVFKDEGFKRIKKLLLGNFEQHLIGGICVLGTSMTVNNKSEVSFGDKSVWHLDMPMPDESLPRLSIRTKYLPTDFPLIMPVNSDMIWSVNAWSDYLFSCLWYSLFEPYFNTPSNESKMDNIGMDCRISNSALLIPPYSIGDNVTIEAGAIVSGAIIGNHSRIGQGSIVRNSILSEGVSLPIGVTVLMCVINAGCVVNSQIRFSILDENVFVGANVSFTDVVLWSDQKTYRDKKTVLVELEAGKFDSGATVLGCAIGANVRIGSNSLLAPGASIEANTRLLPK